MFELLELFELVEHIDPRDLAHRRVSAGCNNRRGCVCAHIARPFRRPQAMNDV